MQEEELAELGLKDRAEAPIGMKGRGAAAQPGLPQDKPAVVPLGEEGKRGVGHGPLVAAAQFAGSLAAGTQFTAVRQPARKTQ